MIRSRNDLISKLNALMNYSSQVYDLQQVSYDLWKTRKSQVEKKIHYYNNIIMHSRVYGNEILSTDRDVQKKRVWLGCCVILQMNNILISFLIGWYMSYKYRLSYASKLWSMLMWLTRWEVVKIYNQNISYQVKVISIY